MIEIRAFEGTAEELAEFVTPIWVGAYAGAICVPLWTPEFFEWALDWTDRDHLVTAWDGGKLIGSLLATSYEMQYFGQNVTATQCSYLTVDPEYRRQGVANLMVDHQHKANRRAQVAFELGYLYTGNRLSMGPSFWKKRQSSNLIASNGFWVRNLDHQAVAGWTPDGLERLGARCLALFQSPPRASQGGTIRKFQVSDVTACRELINELSQQSELGILWNDENLSKQLQFKNLTRTLVWDQNQQIRGFINYCRLDFQAKGVIPVALIDLIAMQQLTSSEQVEMLNHALFEMAQEGIKLAMLPRPGQTKITSLIRTGFVPRIKDFVLQLQPTSDHFEINKTKSLNLLWR